MNNNKVDDDGFMLVDVVDVDGVREERRQCDVVVEDDRFAWSGMRLPRCAPRMIPRLRCGEELVEEVNGRMFIVKTGR